ncbi:YncE family protein, partial [Bacillus cereus]|nr:YncE family protein [Bacillus cereus]
MANSCISIQNLKRSGYHLDQQKKTEEHAQEVGTKSNFSLMGSGQFAYVTNLLSNNVSVINTGSNSVVATIPVGTAPIGIAITPDGDFVYVTNSSSSSNNVSVINTGSNSIVATVSVGTNPRSVAITPDGDFAYVTNSSNNL